jgi:hypothetical protein
MFAMVDFHGAGVDMGFERGGGVGQSRKFKWHS